MFCISLYFVGLCFFFFKQKTAYEMRISDWSSDVCSSDLFMIFTPWTSARFSFGKTARTAPFFPLSFPVMTTTLSPFLIFADISKHLRRERNDQIGRASCRERVCQYV